MILLKESAVEKHADCVAMRPSTCISCFPVVVKSERLQSRKALGHPRPAVGLWLLVLTLVYFSWSFKFNEELEWQSAEEVATRVSNLAKAYTEMQPLINPQHLARYRSTQSDNSWFL